MENNGKLACVGIGGKYRLYLASSIRLWGRIFRQKYSPHLNRKIELFEPGTINTPDDHRLVPEWIAGEDLLQLNRADAVLAYLRSYKTPDGSPCGTDSTWEVGYAIGSGKPVLAIIEDEAQLDYYAVQWMVSFNVSAVIAVGRRIAELVGSNPKFARAEIIAVNRPEEIENALIKYLDWFSRSPHYRMGSINRHVDANARELFSRDRLSEMCSVQAELSEDVLSQLRKISSIQFGCNQDFLVVCGVERAISGHYAGRLSVHEIDSGISACIKEWGVQKEHMLDCLSHSIKPPFMEIKGRRQGVKKTRPWLFHEIYMLFSGAKTEEGEKFAYDAGAVFELYNWMNTYSIDDVFDGSQSRQGEQTVWKKFCRRDAIFTGILGHLIAMKYSFAVSRTTKTAEILAGEINSYNSTMYSGQVFDIFLTQQHLTWQAVQLLGNYYAYYARRIYGICGGFYEVIAQVAAKTAGGKCIAAARLVGLRFGMLQMIRNDLGNLVPNEFMPAMSKGLKESSHNDVEEGKLTLPYYIALSSNRLSRQEKELFLLCLGMRLSEKEKARINELLWKSGAIHITSGIIGELAQRISSGLSTELGTSPVAAKNISDMAQAAGNIILPFARQASANRWTSPLHYGLDGLEAAMEILTIEKIPQSERLAGFERLFG